MSWNCSHYIRQNKGPQSDEDHGKKWDVRFWKGKELMGEEIPHRPTEHNAQRHADDHSDGRRDRRLPGQDGCQLSPGHSKCFQQR